MSHVSEFYLERIANVRDSFWRHEGASIKDRWSEVSRLFEALAAYEVENRMLWAMVGRNEPIETSKSLGEEIAEHNRIDFALSEIARVEGLIDSLRRDESMRIATQAEWRTNLELAIARQGESITQSSSELEKLRAEIEDLSKKLDACSVPYPTPVQVMDRLFPVTEHTTVAEQLADLHEAEPEATAECVLAPVAEPIVHIEPPTPEPLKSVDNPDLTEDLDQLLVRLWNKFEGDSLGIRTNKVSGRLRNRGFRLTAEEIRERLQAQGVELGAKPTKPVGGQVGCDHPTAPAWKPETVELPTPETERTIPPRDYSRILQSEICWLPSFECSPEKAAQVISLLGRGQSVEQVCTELSLSFELVRNLGCSFPEWRKHFGDMPLQMQYLRVKELAGLLSMALKQAASEQTPNRQRAPGTLDHSRSRKMG